MPFFTRTRTAVRPFDPATSGYDPTHAWWLAKLSELAYQNKRRVVEALREAGFNSVTFVDSAGTQGFLAVHPGMLPDRPFAVLAFRGTENDWADILTDLFLLRTKLPDEPYRAHAGFVYAFKEVWGTSVEGLTGGIEVEWYGSRGVSDALEARCRSLPVFCTGHSLGAALATVATHYWQPRALYTYGSPRVAGIELARRFAERGIPVYRVVNATDIVPRVPFAMIGYRHVGRLAYLTDKGKLLLGRSAAFWFYFRSLVMLTLPFSPVPGVLRLFNAVIAGVGPGVFTNHRIGEYVRKLDALAP